MMDPLPALDTHRLTIRPFTMDDLDAVFQILDLDLAGPGPGAVLTLEARAALRRERVEWLEWTVRGYTEFARLYQPPYGERAVVLTQTGALIGACGFVPSFDAFAQLPDLHPTGLPAQAVEGLSSPEFGLFWALAPAHQHRGYATEAARAMIDYAFERLHVARVVATTLDANAPSIAVMRRLGMRIARNPLPTPPWLQVVGMLEHPRIAAPGGDQDTRLR